MKRLLEKLLAPYQAAIDRNTAAMVELAKAFETLRNETCDSLDAIEGQFEEFRKQVSPQATDGDNMVRGHIRWTQRRQERMKKHFNLDQLVNKIQGGKSDA